MAIQMAASHAASRRLKDAIFGANAACRAAIAEHGEERVINATIGAVMDDSGKTISPMRRSLDFRSISRQRLILHLPAIVLRAISPLSQRQVERELCAPPSTTTSSEAIRYSPRTGSGERTTSSVRNLAPPSRPSRCSTKQITSIIRRSQRLSMLFAKNRTAFSSSSIHLRITRRATVFLRMTGITFWTRSRHRQRPERRYSSSSISPTLTLRAKSMRHAPSCRSLQVSPKTS